MICPECHDPQYDPRSGCHQCGHAASDEGAVDPFLGRVVDGRYRVIECIGRGGMGAVYRVEHIRMGKIAAMKLLHPELAREADVVARFQREAKAVSRLSHPHTVQVFDFGEQGGALYLVMEFVKGQELGSLFREGGELPVVRALPILIQLCLALEEAHQAGIVHRDIKPENVLVTRGTDGADYIKVLDFGLALLREGKEQANITAQGNVIGTPYYMAPEQIRGDRVDHRVDIYAMGATLYRLVTGAVPFPAKTPVGVLTKCLTEPLVPPSQRRPDLGISEEVESVILRAMAKDPAQRFQTAREFRKALQSCLESMSLPRARVLGGPSASDVSADVSMADIPLSASPFSSEHNLRREDMDGFERRLRRRRSLAVLLPLVALFLGGAALAYVLLRPAPPERFHETEREPNNTPEEANLIGRGRPVRGQIGRRISETQSDVDVYRFEVKADGAVLFSARLKGIPYIDLSLQIFDIEARELAAVNNGPARTDEILPNHVLGPGTYYAVVQEVAGKTPGTNIDDWYHLTLDWRPLGPSDEVEPNDSLERANRIRSGEPVEGFLARPDDVDMFRPEGQGGGSFDVELTGVPGVDHRLRVVGLRRVSLPLKGPEAQGRAGAGAKGNDASTANGKDTDRHPGDAAAAQDTEPQLAWQPLESVWTREHSGASGEKASLMGLPWPEGDPAPLVIVERDPRDTTPSPTAGAERPYRLTLVFHPGQPGGRPRGQAEEGPARHQPRPSSTAPPRAGSDTP